MINSSRKLFRFFDDGNDTYTPEQNVLPVFWVEGSKVYNAVTAAYGNGTWRVNGNENVINAAIDWTSFEPYWTTAMTSIANTAKAAGLYVYLDMEHIPYLNNGERDYRFALIAAQVFKSVAPELSLGCYYIATFGLSNNEQVIAAAIQGTYDSVFITPELQATIDHVVAITTDFVTLLDSVDCATYMTSEADSQRDIDCGLAQRTLIHRYYDSNKPVIFSLLGSYTVGGAPLSNAVITNLVNSVTTSGDGVILFGLEEPRDNFLVSELNRIYNSGVTTITDDDIKNGGRSSCWSGIKPIYSSINDGPSAVIKNTRSNVDLGVT